MGSHENFYYNPAFSKHPYSSQGKNYPSYPISEKTDQPCLGTGLQITLSFPQSWFCCGRALKLSQQQGEQQVLAPGNPSPTFSLPCELGNLIPAPKWKNFAWQKSLYYASSSILPLLAHVSVLSRGTIATPQTIYSIKNNLLSFVSSFPASEAQERKKSAGSLKLQMLETICSHHINGGGNQINQIHFVTTNHSY